MLFNSPVFILFFAVVYLLYRLLPLRGQNALLLAASFLFYGWWDWRFLGLMVFTMVVDWAAALGMEARPDQRKPLLAASVLVNLTVLGLFKYAGFFTAELNQALAALGIDVAIPVLNLILPVGLSFYTFQSMSYTIDVYRGHVQAQRSLFDFALFVSFFPQLVAGPIERSERLMPQLEQARTISSRQLADGAWLVVWGFFKKVFVADNLAVLVDETFSAPAPGGFRVLIAAYAFTWQIYCDFSGYSDIARGIAKWMGIELMVNFKLPFFASSPRDLWRRWHISLSEWLRDYLYVPLGGNRRGRVRTQVNLLVTMLLGGLWHGANWTYVAWGAYHGLALAMQRAIPELRAGWVGKIIGIFLTFHFTTLGFLVFRARDLGQVGEMLQAIGRSLRPAVEDRYALTQLAVLVAVPALVELGQFLRGEDWVQSWPRPLQAAFVGALVLAVVVLGASAGHQFIYFQF